MIGNVADLRRRDRELRQLAGHGVLLLAELGHPERVEDVDRAELEDRVAVDGQAQHPVVRPFGYSKRHANCCAVTLDAERVAAGAVVLREHDRAGDADHDHEERRDRRPDDLEPRVAVDRRAVASRRPGWARNFQTE